MFVGCFLFFVFFLQEKIKLKSVNAPNWLRLLLVGKGGEPGRGVSREGGLIPGNLPPAPGVLWGGAEDPQSPTQRGSSTQTGT